MIELRQLTKRFATEPAVDRLDLEVHRGEVFGLLGHNGAGKSTTIGMLLGQVWPTDGSVRINGFDVGSERSRALARVGAIFEAPAFYEDLSGWRNLEILASYTARTDPSRIREVVAWVGLAGNDRRPVRTYSHGMRARLALAQALLPNPELLILDEPTNGLDPEGIHEMRGTLRRLHAEFGLTLLLSSHLLTEVEQLCSRIAVLHRGRKVFDGTVSEARSTATWVHLRTDDFAAAAAWLQQRGWITDSKEARLLAPAAGVDIPELVRRLVEGGFPIHQIGPETQSLEGFYLSLVRDAGSSAEARPQSSPH
jgi:ABC-2 type transport system ATP-binding protein